MKMVRNRIMLGGIPEYFSCVGLAQLISTPGGTSAKFDLIGPQRSLDPVPKVAVRISQDEGKSVI